MKYDKFQGRLNFLNDDDNLVTDADEINKYENMLRNNEELPENISYKTGYYGHNFYKMENLNDEEIDAMLEIDKVKSLNEIARTAKLYRILAIIGLTFIGISLIIGFLLAIIGATI